ncbi:uncharacterized protein LOC123519030 isoform X2 [Portunus trituberculatus]|uniref:uncharacterized protein LOC123519030 isoform X2 n=1 Tax=Portunus trituberculatus TaxID=210409 RepID=UPI001E1D1B10|nr:uncharacterized protein LOC123519030 isoform X2 [Portunus trituberculatus]
MCGAAVLESGAVNGPVSRQDLALLLELDDPNASLCSNLEPPVPSGRDFTVHGTFTAPFPPNTTYHRYRHLGWDCLVSYMVQRPGKGLMSHVRGGTRPRVVHILSTYQLPPPPEGIGIWVALHSCGGGAITEL